MRHRFASALVVGFVVAATALFAVPVDAEGQGPDGDADCYWSDRAQRYICRGDGGGGTVVTVPRGPVTTLPYDLMWTPRLVIGPEGRCIDIVYEDLGRPPNASDHLQAELQIMRFLRSNPICPDADLPEGSTPTIEAARFLEEIPLPVPQPYVHPGRLPVGFDAYLETGAPTVRTFGPKQTPFGELSLTARARIYVDWDDPHDDVEGEHGPYDGSPGPYPDGEITHLYQYDGLYQITARYEWVADWQIGNAHTGSIPGATTSGTYPAPGFEVFSRQAVG